MKSGRRVRMLHGFTVDMSVPFIRGQAAYFRERGIDVEVVSSPGPFLTAISRDEGVTTHSVPMLRRISPLADIMALWRLIGVLRSGGFDGVHAHTPKAGLLLTLAARALRIPVRVYHVHGVPWRSSRGLRGLLLRTSERVACSLATHVLCVSDSVRRALIAREMCAPDKCRVPAGGSSNGIDGITCFTPRASSGHDVAATAIRAKHAIAQDAPLACFIGRVANDKGIRELLHAWHLVLEAVPHAQLLIVGPQDDTDPVDPTIMSDIEAEPSIQLHGAEWDTAPIYRTIDLLVLPTYREGFPNVLLEAGACAVPVVATLVDGCVDAVVHDVTGVLVPPRDAVALADAIASYLLNPAIREQHGHAGRARVLEQFSRMAVWRSLDRIYRAAYALPAIVEDSTPSSDTRSSDPAALDRASELPAASRPCPTARTSSVLSTS